MGDRGIDQKITWCDCLNNAIFGSFLACSMMLLAGPSTAQTELEYFGYAAIACDHDDPFDGDDRTNFSAEVAAFTSANQVCVTADIPALATRLRDTAKLFTPVFYVEPVFFKLDGAQLVPNPGGPLLWAMVEQAITDSGVAVSDLIFYIVDEPLHRGLPLAEVSKAADLVRATYPDAAILMISAYQGPSGPEIPAEIDYWGFNAYAIADPGLEPLYTEYLDQAAQVLASHQKLVLVMDANHTPFHTAAGISETDMADVAWNTLRLARDRGDIAMILGYTWSGGVDNLDEKGIRNLPQSVQDAHRMIGLEILGR